MKQFLWYSAQSAIVAGVVWFLADATQPPYNILPIHIAMIALVMALLFTLAVTGLGWLLGRIAGRGREQRYDYGVEPPPLPRQDLLSAGRPER